jgi:hypothetical protein
LQPLKRRTWQQAARTEKGDAADMAEDVKTVVDKNHADRMLSSIETMWKSKSFCDVTVRVKDRDFLTHRYVLAAFSPYFRAMFSSGMAESHQKVITLNEADPDMFSEILSFCYTGKFEITCNNVCELLVAANFFDIPSIRGHCVDYLLKTLDKMDMANCVAIMQLYEQHASAAVKKKAIDVAIRNFRMLRKHPSFSDLTDVDVLLKIISDDKLDISKEEEVWDAVKSWYQFSPEVRKQGFERLIEEVRFPIMPATYLCMNVEKLQDEIQSEIFRKLIEEAKYCHLCPDFKMNLMGKTSRIMRRANLGMHKPAR